MPDSNDQHDGARPEFEVAYFTKELGVSLQREMLQKHFPQLSDGASPARDGDGVPGDDAPPA